MKLQANFPYPLLSIVRNVIKSRASSHLHRNVSSIAPSVLSLPGNCYTISNAPPFVGAFQLNRFQIHSKEDFSQCNPWLLSTDPSFYSLRNVSYT